MTGRRGIGGDVAHRRIEPHQLEDAQIVEGGDDRGDQTGGRDRPQPCIGGGAEHIVFAPEARERRHAQDRQRQDGQGHGRQRTILLQAGQIGDAADRTARLGQAEQDGRRMGVPRCAVG